MELKPYPFTPYLQASVAIAALLIGVSALFASFSVWTSERNARLVEIGVGILRADPQKEPSTAAARKWALDLIDANAGGVKFSAEARKQLTTERLPVVIFSWPTSYGGDVSVYSHSMGAESALKAMEELAKSKSKAGTKDSKPPP